MANKYWCFICPPFPAKTNDMTVLQDTDVAQAFRIAFHEDDVHLGDGHFQVFNDNGSQRNCNYIFF